MKKAEQFRTPNAAQINLGLPFDPNAHGTSGHVVTGFSNPYPCPDDPRGSVKCILSIIPGISQGPNERNNTRSSAAQSYLFSLPPTAKPNLHILVNHRATRIIWDTITGQLPRPQGVYKISNKRIVDFNMIALVF